MMAGVFPELSLPALLSNAVRPQRGANPLLGLKLRPPASFGPAQPPTATPTGVAVGPSVDAASLFTAPMPPPRPPDLGGAPSSSGIIDPSIVARQKGFDPSSALPGPLTPADLDGLIQYQVGGVVGQRPSSAPIFTARRLLG